MTENMHHDEIRCHSNSGCHTDQPCSSRNKVDKFRINLRKKAPTYRAEGAKRQIQNKSEKKMFLKFQKLPFVSDFSQRIWNKSEKSDFHHASDQCCHFMC